MRELLQRRPDSRHYTTLAEKYFYSSYWNPVVLLLGVSSRACVCLQSVYMHTVFVCVCVCLHVNNQILSLMKGLLAMVCYVTLYLSPQTTSCQRKYHSICSSLFFCFSRPWVRKMSIKSCKITHYLKSNLVNCANCGNCIYQESNLFFKQLNLCRKHAEMSCHNGQFL